MSSNVKLKNPSSKYVADMRNYLRISVNKLDAEIIDLVNAARADLVFSGVSADHVLDEKDPLIKMAVRTYVRAEFGLDNDDSEKYRAAYSRLKDSLSLSLAYTNPKR